MKRTLQEHLARAFQSVTDAYNRSEQSGALGIDFPIMGPDEYKKHVGRRWEDIFTEEVVERATVGVRERIEDLFDSSGGLLSECMFQAEYKAVDDVAKEFANFIHRHLPLGSELEDAIRGDSDSEYDWSNRVANELDRLRQ